MIINSDIVIGGDTGPTHMAWAMNIPSITIFGATPAKRNSFETSINLIIGSNSTINPYKIDKYNSSINIIEPEKIVSLVKELL